MKTPSQLRAAVLVGSCLLVAGVAAAADLKVLRTGLGSGTVSSSPAGIACGATCTATFGAVSVTLTAAPAAGSTFAGWDSDVTPDPATTADCSGTALTCTVSLAAARSVRPRFDLMQPIVTMATSTPEAIAAYLALPANAHVNTAARFVAALPEAFRKNWILMTRSESLQTGTAASPRILLPSANAREVFTIGMTTHASYPGSHPNAIEFMQWDPMEKNFRFHEIVLDTIPAMGSVPARSRGVSIDDARCFRCHSTRNVINRSTFPGTEPPGSRAFKSKPNWDAYDSWGGMLPFNRDRIYQGSIEAAAFRKIFNPWTWRSNDAVRAILEQLYLQPPGVDSSEAIVRLRGGADDGRIRFAFDPVVVPAVEPPASSPGTGAQASVNVTYSFDRLHGSGPATTVTRGGDFVHLRHTSDITTPRTDIGRVEGRGVQLFDLLGGLDGQPNALRIADELINHAFATGSVPVDVRPLALALTQPDSDGETCIRIGSGGTATTSDPGTFMPTAAILDFLRLRHGSRTIADLRLDIERRWSGTTPEGRVPSLPRRKADLQRFNLDRTGDFYLFAPDNGLLQEYGAGLTPTPGDTAVDRIRREVFRRPIDLGASDGTVMNNAESPPRGLAVDREQYTFNIKRIALYRYFLEPLGVSVDKWSMNVRGRSRAYNFADVFGSYTPVLESELRTSLTTRPFPGLTPPFTCAGLVNATNSALAGFPARVNEVPTFTDVQRIFNKSCIECHGGLGYPPYGVGDLDLSEDEAPSTTPPLPPSARLARSHAKALARVTTDPATSPLYRKITHLSESCDSSSIGMMPCGGPPLSAADVETVRRWIVGDAAVGFAPFTVGDPHLRTVDGVNYDFQSTGEFVLLRNESLEVQVRQMPVATAQPLPPDGHTGLVSCPSLNTAVALRIGRQRITFQPGPQTRAGGEGTALRIDGKAAKVGAQGLNLVDGGRIVATASGGIQVEAPGGAVIVVTPGWWDHYQLAYLNIDARNTRATEGLMGRIATGSWLPALADGSSLGARPADLHQRHVDLYGRFADAWRVDAQTSLFDYGSGTTPASYVVRGWPAENPQGCALPEAMPPGGPVARAPLPPLPEAEARRLCASVADAAHRGHCERDVMVTGEAGFAAVYLGADAWLANRVPSAPVLDSPDDNAVLGTVAALRWKVGADADGDAVRYRLCVWATAEAPTFASCDQTAFEPPLQGRRGLWLAASLFILLLVAAWWAFRRGQRRRALATLAGAMIVLLMAVVVGQRGAASSIERPGPNLVAGKAYFWKVYAEDGRGGTAQSETRRFTVK
jgi:hypothetical protein